MADGAKAPRGLLIAGVVLLVLALGGCGYGCTSFVGFIGDLTDVAEGSSAVPLGSPTTLEAGGTDNALILTTSTSAVCEVSDSSGADVALQEPGTGTTGTIDRSSGAPLEFQYSFETTEGETYQILCVDDFEGSGEYAVVPFNLGRIVTGFAGIGIGALLFIIGTILLIVGLVQRSKWKKRQVPGSPMGGYSPPPPGGASGYGQPGQGYGQPGQGYGQPPSGYPTPPPPGGPIPPPPGGPTAPPPGGPTAPPPAPGAPWPPQSEPPSGPPPPPPPA